jgi:hypothetical protein
MTEKVTKTVTKFPGQVINVSDILKVLGFISRDSDLDGVKFG